MIDTLIQITGPGFSAGVVARDGKVIQAAPRVARVIRNGMDGKQVADQCRKMGWTWEKISETTSA